MKNSIRKRISSLFLVTVAAATILAGCGEKDKAVQATAPQETTAVVASPTPTAEPAATEEPAQPQPSQEADGEAKGITMTMTEAVYHPEDIQTPIVFKMHMENSGKLNVDVNSLKFYMVTSQGEMLEAALSGFNSSSRYLMPGGKTDYNVVFEIADPSTISGMIFADSNLDIAVKLSAAEFPALTTFGQTPEENPSVEATADPNADYMQPNPDLEGDDVPMGAVKADDFEEDGQ